MAETPELLDPAGRSPGGPLPPLGLLPAGSLTLEQAAAAKAARARQVHLVFPVGSSREAPNLRLLLKVLTPLRGTLLDAVWLACGESRPGGLARLPGEFPGLKIFTAPSHPPPDQVSAPPGKGATMRAFLYHLVVREQVTDPRAVVVFLDADIRPRFFSPAWVVAPAGALLWFEEAWGAKVVYHRPRGGRLNAMVRALLALCPHPGVQSLQKLVYLLSGEMAGTLGLWTTLPFKSGYGVELAMLLSFALNRLHLAPPSEDLSHLVQVHVGEMDHRHAPLTTSPRRRGLDQMAAAVFHTLMETLVQEGIISWGGLAEPRHLAIPQPLQPGEAMPGWLRVPVGDATLPPLRSLPEIKQGLGLRE